MLQLTEESEVVKIKCACSTQNAVIGEKILSLSLSEASALLFSSSVKSNL